MLSFALHLPAFIVVDDFPLAQNNLCTINHLPRKVKVRAPDYAGVLVTLSEGSTPSNKQYSVVRLKTPLTDN